MVQRHNGVKQAWRAECSDVISYDVFRHNVQKRRLAFGVLKNTLNKLAEISDETLMQMYERIGNLVAVASALGVSKNTIYKTFKNRGLSVIKSPIRKPWTKEILDDLLNKHGLGFTSIARIFNASPNGVLYACRMFGVKRTRPSKWGKEGALIGNKWRYGRMPAPTIKHKAVAVDDDAWETMTTSQREEVLRNQKRRK